MSVLNWKLVITFLAWSPLVLATHLLHRMSYMTITVAYQSPAQRRLPSTSLQISSRCTLSLLLHLPPGAVPTTVWLKHDNLSVYILISIVDKVPLSSGALRQLAAVVFTPMPLCRSCRSCRGLCATVLSSGLFINGACGLSRALLTKTLIYKLLILHLKYLRNGHLVRLYWY